ncbi:uncharacterized protein LOC142609040 [Castanea sativa]|uniref:uncharacterized protein LOC142609040 n=1 Tax=Castanea sativa TaxID=21020 RepID=UPI003F64EC6A
MKAGKSRLEKVKKSIGFSELIVVDAKGSASGTCAMWKSSVSLHPIEFNKNLIVVKVTKAVCDWFLVGFYGPPYATKKKNAWENLMALLESFQSLWVCMGDFNFIISDNEILGGNRGGSSATNYLKELIFEFGAIDLGCSGNKFTWAKRGWGNSAIKRRLDRGIANISWRLAFPRASIAHLGAISSDHAPLLLDTNPKDSFAHRPFRFEAARIRDNNCNSIVEKACNERVTGSAMVKLCKKQAATREALRKWNKEIFGHYQDKINCLMNKIAEVQKNPPSTDNGKIESVLLTDLSEWLARSEVMWRQIKRTVAQRRG